MPVGELPHEREGYAEILGVLMQHSNAHTIQHLLLRLAHINVEAAVPGVRTRLVTTDLLGIQMEGRTPMATLYRGLEMVPTVYLSLCLDASEVCPCRRRSAPMGAAPLDLCTARTRFQLKVWCAGEYALIGSLQAAFVSSRWCEMDAALHDTRVIGDPTFDDIRDVLALVNRCALVINFPSEGIDAVDHLHELASEQAEALRPLTFMRLTDDRFRQGRAELLTIQPAPGFRFRKNAIGEWEKDAPLWT